MDFIDMVVVPFLMIWAALVVGIGVPVGLLVLGGELLQLWPTFTPHQILGSIAMLAGGAFFVSGLFVITANHP